MKSRFLQLVREYALSIAVDVAFVVLALGLSTLGRLVGPVLDGFLAEHEVVALALVAAVVLPLPVGVVWMTHDILFG